MGAGGPATHIPPHPQLPTIRSEASAAGVRLGEDAAFEWALDEARDAAEGLGALLRATPTATLLRGTDVSALFAHTADFAGALLGEVAALSVRVRTGLASGGGAAARAELEAFSESRLRPVTDTVQACLEVWVLGVGVLSAAETASSPLAAGLASRLAGTQAAARERAPVLYERVVSARLQLATVSVLAGLDDDDPFEDERWVMRGGA